VATKLEAVVAGPLKKYFFVASLSVTAFNSEKELRTENLGIYIMFIFKSKAIYVKHYTRMSVLISFLAFQLKNSEQYR